MISHSIEPCGSGRKEGIYMFEKVIIATDLSSAAFAVLKDIENLKTFGTRKILLVQCLDQRESDAIAVTYATNALDKNLEEQKRVLEAKGFEVEVRVVPGLAKNEVKRIAEEEDYSLILAGGETRNLLSDPLMGGIAYEIIHFCTKPFLLVRLEGTKKDGGVYYTPVRSSYNLHVLFPTDFSAASYDAFEVLKEMTAAGIRKITLMHVQDQSRIDPYLLAQLSEFNSKDEARLDAMKKTLEDISPTVQVDTVLFYGSPTRYILDAIEDRGVQLVVMGSQGRGFIRDVFLGSVSHNIARQARASVMLIPARRD